MIEKYNDYNCAQVPYLKYISTFFIIIFFVIVCISISRGQQSIQDVKQAGQGEFLLSDPCMVLDKVNQYILSGELEKAFEAKYRGTYGEKYLVMGYSMENFLPRRITYSLSHDQARITYLINDSFIRKQADNAKGYNIEYREVVFEVDKTGVCSLFGVNEERRNNDRVKDVSDFKPGDMNEILRIATWNTAGTVKYPVGPPWMGFIEYEYIEKKIKERIPRVMIGKEQLIPMYIENPTGDDPAMVTYCLKPTIYRRSSKIVAYYSIMVEVKPDGQCEYKYLTLEHSNDCTYGNNDRKDIYIDPNEYEDIYEAGFRYLYEDSGFKDRDFKMIFLEIRSESEIPDEFYQRFNGVPIPVRSPFKKYDDYEGDFRDGRYWADDENDIVVDINGIYEFDKTHVFLDCSDSTSFSPGWRFIYLLEKKDGKWVVVQADQISEL